VEGNSKERTTEGRWEKGKWDDRKAGRKEGRKKGRRKGRKKGWMEGKWMHGRKEEWMDGWSWHSLECNPYNCSATLR
jgi:hypothetical protein